MVCARKDRGILHGKFFHWSRWPDGLCPQVLHLHRSAMVDHSQHWILDFVGLSDQCLWWPWCGYIYIYLMCIYIYILCAYYMYMCIYIIFVYIYICIIYLYIYVYLYLYMHENEVYIYIYIFTWNIYTSDGASPSEWGGGKNMCYLFEINLLEFVWLSIYTEVGWMVFGDQIFKVKCAASNEQRIHLNITEKTS